MSGFGDLPEVIADIAEAAGMAAAWKLVEAKGGQTVFIPAHARHAHWLTDLVGFEAARKICDYYRVNDNGTKLLIPMGSPARRRAAWAGVQLTEGMSVNETAEALGVHRRTVLRHRRKLKRSVRADDRQGKLLF